MAFQMKNHYHSSWLVLFYLIASMIIPDNVFVFAMGAKSGLLGNNHGKTYCKLTEDHKIMQCSLRTLQSEIDATDNDIGRAKQLEVKCSDMYFFESKLKSEHFGKLPLLEELDIEFCKIRHLPPRAFAGLSNLKRLSIQSHNSEWTSILLDIDSNSFQKLALVEDINLSNNNLWSLPINTLCNLPKIKKLNISRNHLLNTVDLGLSFIGGCPVPLVELDISHNRITSLGNGDLHQVKDLVKLDLSANRLKILDENALATLPYLQELNLADNQLSALPPAVFNKSQSLHKLMLQNNSLSMLTSQLFSGLTNLTVLNLSRNAISSHLLAPDVFTTDLKHLKVLDLSYNQMSKLQTSIFAELISLQVLNLAHNQFHIISSGVFAFQTRLNILSLSHNIIENIEKDAFVGLNSLTSLSLDHNKVRNLYENQLDESASSLEDVSFNSNLLIEVPRAIAILYKLRTLDLGENEISAINQDDFTSLINLYGLRIAGNRIQKISKNHFANTSNLHVLNLAHNQLSEIEPEAFSSLQNLRALRLDNNRLRDINGRVSALNNLQWFNVSSNRLQWFDYAFIPKSLEWLDIHDNEIEELGNYYHMKSGFSLKSLDASSNLIRSLRKLSLPPSLERVILNRNAIRQIADNTFEDKPYLSRVELASNEINHMKLKTLSVGKLSSTQGRPEFFLAGNPLVCDCNLDWLPEINDDPKYASDSPIIMDLDDVTCRVQTSHLHTTDVAMPIKSVLPEQFVCSYQTHCFSLCMCCDFYACDCRMQCPDGCSCYHDSTWSINIIKCGGGQRHKPQEIELTVAGNDTSVTKSKSLLLEEVPLLIPMDATSVYLDGNNLGSVDTQSFIGRRRITSLYMNSSRITEVSRETFGGLSNSLKRLHLEDNRLSELFGHEFETLANSPLKELYLQNNDIVRISRHTFEPLRSLSILRLDGNLLTTSPMWNILSGNSHPFLVAVYLAENMWSCECAFVQRFNRFVRSLGRDKVVDRSKLKCVTDNFVNELMDNVLNDEGMCENKFVSGGAKDVSQNKDSKKMMKKDLLPILVSAAIAVAVLVVGFLAVCVYKKKIKNWLYNKSTEIYESSRSSSSTVSASCVVSSGAFTGDNQLTHSPSTIYPNKLFDVYISYSSKDADFVDNTLAPTLEQGTGITSPNGTEIGQTAKYRICLHQRNFPPNASVYDTVSVASESSSRILVVLSYSYLETEWPDIKTPLRNALGGLSGAVNGRLILLLLEDISSTYADSDLQFYLKTCPTIKWGSSGYLNKLNFFLPEPAFMTFQRSVTLRTLHHTDTPLSGTPAPSSVRSSTSKYMPKSGNKKSFSFKSKVSSAENNNAFSLSDQSMWAYTVDRLPVDSVTPSNFHIPPSNNGNLDAESLKRFLLLQQLQNQQRSLQRDISGTTMFGEFQNKGHMNNAQLYGHHTYQSIPESHIYHTLEPSSLEQNINDMTGNMYVVHNPVSSQKLGKPPSSVYINKNLDLILKPTASFRNRGGDMISDGTESGISTYKDSSRITDELGEVNDNGNSTNSTNKISISSPSSSSTSTTSNDLTSESSSASQKTPSSVSQTNHHPAQHNSSCHHIHTNSTLSAQQLIPSIVSGDGGSSDEYIV